MSKSKGHIKVKLQIRTTDFRNIHNRKSSRLNSYYDFQRAPNNMSENSTTIQTTLETSIDNGDLTVPVLPRVANEILQMSQDSLSDMSDLSQLVHQDQSIAGSVLRIANSAAFAPAERIVSLQQAVTWLGLQLLSEIALSVAVQANVFHSVKYNKEIADMWKHALASAVFGKEIARSIRRNVEGQYLCGLLHAIGKPVVLKSIESLETKLNLNLEHQEVMQLVNTYHIRAGEIVTKKWNLPLSVQVANEYYQQYEQAESFRMETAITYLADKLAQAIVEETINPERDLMFDPVFTFLNIYPDDRMDIFRKMDDVKNLTASMLI